MIKRLKDSLKQWRNFQLLFFDQDEDTCVKNVDKFQNMIADHEIIELKTNHIPKGLVPLER